MAGCELESKGRYAIPNRGMKSGEIYLLRIVDKNSKDEKIIKFINK